MVDIVDKVLKPETRPKVASQRGEIGFRQKPGATQSPWYLVPGSIHAITILRLTTDHATVGPKLDAITDYLEVSNFHQSSKRSSHDLAGEVAMCDWQALPRPRLQTTLLLVEEHWHMAQITWATAIVSKIPTRL